MGTYITSHYLEATLSPDGIFSAEDGSNYG